MADLVFKNFAVTTLAQAVAVPDTAILVNDGSVFPDAPAEGEFVCTLEDVSGNREIVRCTARSGESLTVTRAQEGTAAQAFNVGDVIELRYTAASMDEYFARIGLDAGTWTTATGSPTRKKLQIRRNYADPGDVPGDLYEGELVVNAADATPRLFLGPENGNNDGAGIPILPIVTGTTPPLNPYNGLLYFATDTKLLSIWDASADAGSGAWVAIFAEDVTGQTYATVAYVDAQVTALQGQLNAPSGTRMVFHQTDPPAGWVRDDNFNGHLLFTDTNGGSNHSGGNWTISGLTVAGHKITVAQMPSHNHGGGNHNHSISDVISSPGSGLGFGSGRTLGTKNTTNSGATVDSQGNNQAHSHGISHDGNWRPPMTYIILAVKS